MIRDLGPNEVIREPGFYRMPLERHHDQPCDGPSVTSGVLRKMELWTPADVWAFHKLNPDRYEAKETDAQRMGSAMALYVEGGKGRLLDVFNVHAEDKPRRPTAGQIAAYDDGRASEAAAASVEYWRAVDAAASYWLTPAELAEIEAMGKVLAADPAAAAVMAGEPEVTMAWRDEASGLWLLARPDTVAFDGTVTDYKKVNTAGRPFSWSAVDKRITEHGYDMQLAFAAEVFERLTGQWPAAAGIIAQWDQPPYHVILREIAEEDLRIGQWRNRRAIMRFAECLASRHWPGPGEDVGQYRRPDWQRDALLAEMNTAYAAPMGE